LAIDVSRDGSRQRKLYYQIPLLETIAILRDRIAADMGCEATLVFMHISSKSTHTKLTVRIFDTMRVAEIIERATPPPVKSKATGQGEIVAMSDTGGGGGEVKVGIGVDGESGEIAAAPPVLSAHVGRYGNTDTKMHIASPLVGRNLEIDDRRAMNLVLSENKSNFDLLFTLIALRGQPALVSRAWALLRRLPTNEQIQNDIDTLGGRVVLESGGYAPKAPPRPRGRKQDTGADAAGELEPTAWDQLLDGTATLQLLYSLRLVNEMSLQPERQSWNRLLVTCGGRSHLLQLVAHLDVAAYLRTPLFTSCLVALLQAASFFLSMRVAYEEDGRARAEFDPSIAPGVVRVCVEIMQHIPNDGTGPELTPPHRIARSASLAEDMKQAAEEEQELYSWEKLTQCTLRLLVVAADHFGPHLKRGGGVRSSSRAHIIALLRADVHFADAMLGALLHAKDVGVRKQICSGIITLCKRPGAGAADDDASTSASASAGRTTEEGIEEPTSAMSLILDHVCSARGLDVAVGKGMQSGETAADTTVASSFFVLAAHLLREARESELHLCGEGSAHAKLSASHLMQLVLSRDVIERSSSVVDSVLRGLLTCLNALLSRNDAVAISTQVSFSFYCMIEYSINLMT
tara:strand:- start:3769 stop:5664 length:1896 start_codon:yes stop_codon:yes gene_type:complete